MVRLLLIRHGNTAVFRDVLCGRMPGVALDEEGREQARGLGLFLKQNSRLTAVYSSPVERAVQTAEQIAVPQNLGVHLVPGLAEIEFGEWTGERFSDLSNSAEWRAYNRERSLRAAPGGESLLTVQNRSWSSLLEIFRQHSEGTIAAVTHGDVIRAVLLLLLGMPLDHILRIEVAPASITEISYGDGGPVVHRVNWHL